MKNYLPILVFFVFTFFAGCKKDPVPEQLSSLKIDNISYSAFGTSTWTHVAGGMISIEFGLIGANGTVSTKTVDSVDIKNISTYQKQLSTGKYDIEIASKNQSAVADTFIRFNALLKSFDTQQNSAVSFTAVSTDGLITISKSFIKDGTIPTFKPDNDAKTYKLGFKNGHYYIYVKPTVNGIVSFTSKETEQSVGKALTIASLTHYNLGVVANTGGLEIILSPFVRVDESVSSSTLVTIEASPFWNTDKSTYFVATDELGNILNEVKFIKNTSSFKIVNETFTKDRFNLFQINVSSESNVARQIVGYMQIKRGSTLRKPRSYNSDPNITEPLKVHLKNGTSFDKLSIATDQNLQVFKSLSDTIGKLFSFSNDSRIWVQMLKNNQVSYNFFDIAKGVKNYDIDLAQVNRTPNMVSMTSPGANFGVSVIAKKDKTKEYRYNFGQINAQFNQIDYYYPTESFQEYVTSYSYTIGNFDYSIINTGATIPAQAPSFPATFTVTGTTMKNFKPSPSGQFSYYTAHFEGTDGGQFFAVDLFSPSEANFSTFKFPDFAKYLEVSSLDLDVLKLKSVTLRQQDGYSEKLFPYNSGDTNVNMKQIKRNF